MAASHRIGSIALSRLRARSTSRAFSTSVAFRADSDRNEPPRPVRLNPLVGNRLFNPEPAKPAAKQEPREPISPTTPLPTIKLAGTAPSNATSPKPEPEAGVPPPPPPPPPSAMSILSNLNLKPPPKHAYNATAAEKKPIDITTIIAQQSLKYATANETSVMARPQIHAKAVTGRTVFIKDRITPTAAPTPTIALRVLNKMMREQQIRNKWHSQRFHERKGLKRKRLASQRWRVRFKDGFKATVNRVLELKRQGW